MRGYVHPDFEPVRDALGLYTLKNRPGGAAVCIYHRGEVVVDLAIGTADEAGRPFERDSLAVSMSTTKGVTATAVHALVAKGEIDYDAPLARYWPEFAQQGKGRLTVGEALAHRAGLHELAPLITHLDQLNDWSFMTHAIERATPSFEPGSDFAYHAFTYGWIIGELVRRVASTETFPEALEQVLSKPYGLDGLFVGVPASAAPRVADYVGLRHVPEPSEKAGKALLSGLSTIGRATGLRISFEETARSIFPDGIGDLDLNDADFRRASMPAVNGHFDAHSLAKLYSAYAGDGTIDGQRLVTPEQIARIRSENNGFLALCRVIPFPLRLGLGYHRIISLGLRIPIGGGKDIGVPSPNAFGHFGIGGSGAWADPERELSVGVVTNRVIGKLPMDLRTVGIATAAAYAADRRARR